MAYSPKRSLVEEQTFQPLSHANLEVLKTSPEKPGDWDLKPGDFQNMCQIIKKSIICLRVFLFYLFSAPCCTLWQLFWQPRLNFHRG